MERERSKIVGSRDQERFGANHVAIGGTRSPEESDHYRTGAECTSTKTERKSDATSQPHHNSWTLRSTYGDVQDGDASTTSSIAVQVAVTLACCELRHVRCNIRCQCSLSVRNADREIDSCQSHKRWFYQLLVKFSKYASDRCCGFRKVRAV